MELILSSPLPVAALFLGLIIVGVFIFELRSKHARQSSAPPPPLPPTSIPMPKPPTQPASSKKKLIIAAGAVILVLAIALPALLIVVNQKSQVINRAQTPTKPAGPVPTVEPTIGPATAVTLDTTAQSQSISPTTPVTTPPTCLGLSAQPVSGRVPLSVSFTARAHDASSIASINFDFGDGTNKKVEKGFTPGTDVTQPMDHVYTQEGNYNASVTVTNSKNITSPITSTCQMSIIASAGTAVGGTSGSSGSGTLIPTSTLVPTKIITPTPTKIASGSGVVQPNLPESGTVTPTAMIMLTAAILFILSATTLLRR